MLSGSCHKRPSLDKFLLPRKPLKKKKKTRTKMIQAVLSYPETMLQQSLDCLLLNSAKFFWPFSCAEGGGINLLQPGPSRDPNSSFFSCACPLLPLPFLLNGSWRNRREEPARRVSESAMITIRHCHHIALPTPRRNNHLFQWLQGGEKEKKRERHRHVQGIVFQTAPSACQGKLKWGLVVMVQVLDQRQISRTHQMCRKIRYGAHDT